MYIIRTYSLLSDHSWIIFLHGNEVVFDLLQELFGHFVILLIFDIFYETGPYADYGSSNSRPMCYNSSYYTRKACNGVLHLVVPPRFIKSISYCSESLNGFFPHWNSSFICCFSSSLRKFVTSRMSSTFLAFSFYKTASQDFNVFHRCSFKTTCNLDVTYEIRSKSGSLLTVFWSGQAEDRLKHKVMDKK